VTRYRYEATTVGGFVQQLAVSYLRHGYWFYVASCIPEGKDPRAVDRKLLDLYEIEQSKWSRARRKKAGLANMQYLRHGRFCLLLATHREHPFFEREAGAIRDAREQPITFAGYAISHRRGRSCVRIEANEMKYQKARLARLAGRLSTEALEREFRLLPYEPYAPVRKGLFVLLRAVNGVRDARGLPRVAADCLRLKRRIYRPFAPWRPMEVDGEKRLLPPTFRRDRGAGSVVLPDRRERVR
jgi:hypothetical protein